MQFLVEKARQALSRQICLQYAADDRLLRVLTISQSLEQKILDSSVTTASGIVSAMDPPTRNAWIKALSRSVAAVEDQGWFPIILCTEEARYPVKLSIERDLPNLVVLSVLEVVADVTVELVGEIRVESEMKVEVGS
jgi:flagellar biosynthesis protein FlhA